MSTAESIWQECARSAARMPQDMRTRDKIIHAIDSFALYWDTEFGFEIHDPNDVKELARWIRNHLEPY